MRHAKKGYKLSRTASHRKATLAALSGALIRHKRITTTLTKAKALRIYVEPLITRARADTTHNRREVFRHLMDKTAVTELFDAISEKVGDRPGGYTRILRLGQRQGDAAEMAVIELVDYNESVPETRRSRRRRTRRGGRRRGSTSGQAAARYDLPASSAGQEDGPQVEDDLAEVAAPEDALVEDAPVESVAVPEVLEDVSVEADAESDTVSVAESEDVSAEAEESDVEDVSVEADAESDTVSVAESEDVSAEAEESDVEDVSVEADAESDTVSVADSEDVSAETAESDEEDVPLDDVKDSAESRSDESATG